MGTRGNNASIIFYTNLTGRCIFILCAFPHLFFSTTFRLAEHIKEMVRDQVSNCMYIQSSHEAFARSKLLLKENYGPVVSSLPFIPN